jgi:DMSO/TMAO reductase YedYZ molybdopterin-dependent catalytic subunit
MNRRQMFKHVFTAAGWAVVLASPLAGWVRRSWAKPGKRLLPPDTDLGKLLFENPAHLDTRNLPITPVEKFNTMGLTDHPVDLERWRLSIGGAVAGPLRLEYRQITALPAVERNVLLICPGVFAYHAHWKGVSLDLLLQAAGVDPTAAFVDVKGPAGPYAKAQRFPMAEAKAGAAFLAYAVNGQTLPARHGFPLRAVADGYLGADWVKFVDTVEAVIAPLPPPGAPGDRSAPAYLP